MLARPPSRPAPAVVASRERREQLAAPWRGYARGPRPALTLALVVLGLALLVPALLGMDWPAVRAQAAALPGDTLAGAGALAALGYAVYCSFDLLARRTTGHTVDRPRVLLIGFVAHACALNLGPAGAGVRFRLYGRHGLPAHLTAALWLFNVATNWIGFVLIAGAALATRRIALPAAWDVTGLPLQGVGVALLGAVAAYLLACRFGHHRGLVVRGVAFHLPRLTTALLQCALSAAHWLLLGAIVHVLLRGAVPFDRVMLALMASALALAVVDVPAGLGVTETVFLTLLAPFAPAPAILGALLVYRALYFVLPLALACVVYLVLEWDALAARRAGRVRDARPVRALPAPRARCRPPVPAEPRPTPPRSP